jgi:hypothetical protein
MADGVRPKASLALAKLPFSATMRKTRSISNLIAISVFLKSI